MDSRKRNYLSKHIVGIDFDPILVRASKMNMVMNNDGTGQLFHANSLEPFSAFSPKTRKALRLDADSYVGAIRDVDALHSIGCEPRTPRST